MDEFLSFLHSIPDVIWSGVIASGLTLGGVLLSNRRNTKNLLHQLKHDADQREKDGIATIRREVYLSAAEELTKANVFIGSLAQVDLVKVNVAEGLQSFFAVAAKLQLVAEQRTALLVNELAAEYNELFLELLKRLVPLQKLRVDIALRDQLYEKAAGEVNRILAEIGNFNEAAQKNDAVFGALNRAFEFHQAHCLKFNSERIDLWAQYYRCNLEFCRGLVIDMRHLGEIQIPVVIEIRRDLGLTGDLAAFQAQMQAQWERMARKFDAVVKELEVAASSESTANGKLPVA